MIQVPDNRIERKRVVPAGLLKRAPDLLEKCQEIYQEIQRPKIGSYKDFENWVEESLGGILKEIEREP